MKDFSGPTCPNCEREVDAQAAYESAGGDTVGLETTCENCGAMLAISVSTVLHFDLQLVGDGPDLDPPEQPCCHHCGKPLYDFGDMGCEYCDARHPLFRSI